MPLRISYLTAADRGKALRCGGCTLALLTSASLLISCTVERGLRHGEVWECANKASPDCAAARERFQVVRYLTFSSDHLVAASATALGDLNFDTRRDDAQGKVSGDFIATAPTHSGQFDELMKNTLKTYAPAAVSAQVDVSPLPNRDTGADVRLRLYFAVAGSTPQLIDNVAPYQLFFRQLGSELGNPPAAAD
jgi:hypothetical protein